MQAQEDRRVVVVGRGIIGLSIAWEAVQAGYSVTLVGPASRSGTATAAAVGYCGLQGQVWSDSPLFRAKMAGQALLPGWLNELERASGTKIPRSAGADGGALEPFLDRTGYAAIRRRVFHRMFTGCRRLYLLDAKPSRAAFHNLPKLARSVRGAFVYPGDLWFDPEAARTALEVAIRVGGATTIEALVCGIVPGPTGRASLLLADGRTIGGDNIVLACGVFANDLLKNEELQELKQRVVAGDTLDFELPDALPDAASLLTFERRSLILRGRLGTYGSTSRLVSSLDQTQGAAASVGAAALSADLYDRWAGSFRTLGVRTGLRGRFDDRYPAVGSASWPQCSARLWVALGFYKNGLQLAPWVARRLVAFLRSEAPTELDLAFSVQRLFAR